MIKEWPVKHANTKHRRVDNDVIVDHNNCGVYSVPTVMSIYGCKRVRSKRTEVVHGSRHQLRPNGNGDTRPGPKSSALHDLKPKCHLDNSWCRATILSRETILTKSKTTPISKSVERRRLPYPRRADVVPQRQLCSSRAGRGTNQNDDRTRYLSGRNVCNNGRPYEDLQLFGFV